ncbi:hypothetical protein LINPERPRIM_LOCUS25280 [Linum perenne]
MVHGLYFSVTGAPRKKKKKSSNEKHQVDIEGDAELVSTKLLAGRVLSNLEGAIVEEIL